MIPLYEKIIVDKYNELNKEPVFSARGDMMARSMTVDMSAFQMDFLDESEEEEENMDSILQHFEPEETSLAVKETDGGNEMSKTLNRFCKAIDCINTISKYIETRRGKNEELAALFDIFQV